MFIVDISVGAEHSLALMADGKVYGWGNNTDWQLGLGHNYLNVREPTLIPGLVSKNILQVGSESKVFYLFMKFEKLSSFVIQRNPFDTPCAYSMKFC